MVADQTKSENTSQANNATRSWSASLWRWRTGHMLRFGLLVIVLLGLSRWAQKGMKSSGPNSEPSGFVHGIVHGAMMPLALPALLLGQDPALYQTHNSGRPYKLGYTTGVNLCGAIFFGSAYSRLRRLQARRGGGQ